MFGCAPFVAHVSIIVTGCTFLPPAGVGLDFNTELAEAISKVKGANYFSVHSPGEFKQRLVQQFDYAVT